MPGKGAEEPMWGKDLSEDMAKNESREQNVGCRRMRVGV